MMNLTAVDFTRVTLRDCFWAPRLETNRKVTLPINTNICKDGTHCGDRPGVQTG